MLATSALSRRLSALPAASTVRGFAAQCGTPLKEGQTVPEVVFKARVRDDSLGGSNPFKWKDIKSSDLFGKKRVVLFALPGAFTPTCSSTHLPGYEKAYSKSTFIFIIFLFLVLICV
jgi:hypothetical protein